MSILAISPAELPPPARTAAAIRHDLMDRIAERIRVQHVQAKRAAEIEIVARLRARYGHSQVSSVPRRVVAEVAVAHDVAPRDIMGLSHKYKVVRARQHAIYRVSIEMPKWSYVQLGRFFNRDHTTVWWAIRTHCERNGLTPPHRVRGRPGIAMEVAA